MAIVMRDWVSDQFLVIFDRSLAPFVAVILTQKFSLAIWAKDSQKSLLVILRKVPQKMAHASSKNSKLEFYQKLDACLPNFALFKC